MTEASSYTAWDDNLYEWPPPDGWYQAVDGRWWPPGYGPEVADASHDHGSATAGFDGESFADDTGVSDLAFDPEMTAAFPAGAQVPGSLFATADLDDESRRLMFEAPPPIDDVFGGIDPFAPLDGDNDSAPDTYSAPDAYSAPNTYSAPDAYSAPDTYRAGSYGADTYGTDAAVTSGAGGPETVIGADPAATIAADPDDLIGSGPAPSVVADPAGPKVPDWGATVVAGDPDATMAIDPFSLGSGAGPLGGDSTDDRTAQFGAVGLGADDVTNRLDPDQLRSLDVPPGAWPIGAGGEQPAASDAVTAPAVPGRGWRPLVAVSLAVVLVGAGIAAYLAFRPGGGEASIAQAGVSGPGSFDQPYGFGTGVVVFYRDSATDVDRRWVIQVLDPVVDATDSLVDQVSAEPPGSGEVLALTRVRVTYQSGPEPGGVSELRLNAVGASGTIYTAAADGCSAVTAPLDVGAQLAMLESTAGELCWSVAAEDLASLYLAVEAGDASGTVHLRLQ